MPKPYPKSGMPPKKAKKPLKRTPLKKKFNGISIAKKAIKKKPKKTGELSVFKEIWEERDPWCEWCGKGILEFNVANYHHIIEKSKSLELRLDKNNIVKICFDCHFNAHNK